jgi:hypothetical protein
LAVALILRKSRLSDDEFSTFIKQIEKLNLEQIEIALNSLLLAKSEFLYLYNKEKHVRCNDVLD